MTIWFDDQHIIDKRPDAHLNARGKSNRRLPLAILLEMPLLMVAVVPRHCMIRPEKTTAELRQSKVDISVPTSIYFKPSLVIRCLLLSHTSLAVALHSR